MRASIFVLCVWLLGLYVHICTMYLPAAQESQGEHQISLKIGVMGDYKTGPFLPTPLHIKKKKKKRQLLYMYLLIYLSYLFICLFVCSCVFVCGHVHAIVHIWRTEDDLQSWFLPSPMGFWGLNPGCPVLWLMPLSTEPSCWPSKKKTHKKNPMNR